MDHLRTERIYILLCDSETEMMMTTHQKYQKQVVEHLPLHNFFLERKSSFLNKKIIFFIIFFLFLTFSTTD